MFISCQKGFVKNLAEEMRITMTSEKGQNILVDQRWIEIDQRPRTFPCRSIIFVNQMIGQLTTHRKISDLEFFSLFRRTEMEDRRRVSPLDNVRQCREYIDASDPLRLPTVNTSTKKSTKTFSSLLNREDRRRSVTLLVFLYA